MHIRRNAIAMVGRFICRPLLASDYEIFRSFSATYVTFLNVKSGNFSKLESSKCCSSLLEFAGAQIYRLTTGISLSLIGQKQNTKIQKQGHG